MPARNSRGIYEKSRKSGIIFLIFISIFLTACGAKPITVKDYVVEQPGNRTTVDCYEENAITVGGYKYHSFYCLPDSATPEEGIIETARGIHLGDSVSDVENAYGKETLQPTENWSGNAFYAWLLRGNSEMASVMDRQCDYVLTYTRQGIGSIQFYFDEEKTLSWVVFEIF